mgnify:CR=1 FL=1
MSGGVLLLQASDNGTVEVKLQMVRVRAPRSPPLTPRQEDTPTSEYVEVIGRVSRTGDAVTQHAMLSLGDNLGTWSADAFSAYAARSRPRGASRQDDAPVPGAVWQLIEYGYLSFLFAWTPRSSTRDYFPAPPPSVPGGYPRMDRGDARSRARSARDARNLTYEKQVPSFLRSLHAQVHGSEPAAEQLEEQLDAGPGPEHSGERSKREREERARSAEAEEADERAQAQGGGRNEDRHLSREDYEKQRAKDQSQPEQRTGGTAAAQDMGTRPGPRARKREKRPALDTTSPDDPMAYLKETVRARKEGLRKEQVSTDAKRMRRTTKDTAGARLSFEIDE